MPEALPISLWCGRLTKVVLFMGSKSEREHLVLETPGRRFRLRFEDATGGQLLGAWLGQTIEIEGRADDGRGHWRLSVSNDALRKVRPTSPQGSALVGLALASPRLSEQSAEKSDDNV